MRSWRNQERALIEDARQEGALLRVTWHEPEQRFVVSHWRDNLCIAATQIDVRDAGAMVGVLVDGLASSVSRPAPTPTAPPPGLVDRLFERWRARAA